MDQKPLHFLVRAASFVRRISKTSLGLTPGTTGAWARRTFFDRDDGAALVGIDQRHIEPRAFLQERDVAREELKAEYTIVQSRMKHSMLGPFK